jgi:arginyl-tRNA synthetase
MEARVSSATTIAESVTEAIDHALHRAVAAGRLPEPATRPPIVVERPADRAHGDVATNIALRLAREAGMAPRQVAEAIVEHLEAPGLVATAEVAGPGFINLRLDTGWVARRLDDIIAAGDHWGDVDLGGGRSVLVEFISANPTGPVTLGATRGAAVGDALGNVLSAAGHRVRREYYVNDAGSRMHTFHVSCAWYYRRMCGLDDPAPDEPYPAAAHAAGLLYDQHGAALVERPVGQLGRLGIEAQLEEIRHDVERLGIQFDRWFSEQSLFDSGAVDAMLARLRKLGFVAERDGAVWFEATRLGHDKDEVLIRSNGMPTYFMTDIAYHLDKLEARAFDRAVDVVGADHAGHLPRMFAALRALGLDDDRLAAVVTQLVTVGGTKMKKADGHYVTLAEVLELVGGDAIRFFLISRSANSTIDFDLDLAVRAGNENPVYYVQMAHARCAGVSRQADTEGVADGDVDLDLLGADASPLVQLLLELPEVVTAVARDLEPHRLTFYAQSVAAAWHRYYHDHRIVDVTEPAISRARLRLADGVRVTLARTLALMGMSAPERM